MECWFREFFILDGLASRSSNNSADESITLGVLVETPYGIGMMIETSV